MTANLDLDLLRTFVGFADTGSFTRAAERVGRTQSAVSMQMRRLEELTGRALFERVGRSLTLTSEGRTLLGYARRMLALNEEAVNRFAEPELTGTVRVGTPDDYTNTLLPVLFSRFAETYPLVHLEIRCQDSITLRGMLDDGTLDMGLLSLDPGHREGIVLRREPVVFAASDTHLAHEQDPVPLALFMPNCKFHQWATEACDRVGKRYRIAYTSPNVTALTAAVHAGLAVTAMATSSLSPVFRVLTPADGFPDMGEVEIALVQAEKRRTEASARLAEHIVESFRHDRGEAVAAE